MNRKENKNKRKKLYKKGGTKYIDKSINAMLKSYQGKDLSGADYERDIASFKKAYGQESADQLTQQLSVGPGTKPIEKNYVQTSGMFDFLNPKKNKENQQLEAEEEKKKRLNESAKNAKFTGKGENVKQLQLLLNRAGYDLDSDGVWGPNTQAAYLDYKSGNQPNIMQAGAGNSAGIAGLVPLPLRLWADDIAQKNYDIPLTEKNVNKNILESVRQTTRDNIEAGDMSVSYEDWAPTYQFPDVYPEGHELAGQPHPRAGQMDETGLMDLGNTSERSDVVQKTLFNPDYKAKTAFGGGQIVITPEYIDPYTGEARTDTLFTDQYNFNNSLRNTEEGEELQNLSFMDKIRKARDIYKDSPTAYTGVRNIAKHFASPENEGRNVMLDISERGTGGRRRRLYRTGGLLSLQNRDNYRNQMLMGYGGPRMYSHGGSHLETNLDINQGAVDLNQPNTMGSSNVMLDRQRLQNQVFGDVNAQYQDSFSGPNSYGTQATQLLNNINTQNLQQQNQVQTGSGGAGNQTAPQTGNQMGASWFGGDAQAAQQWNQKAQNTAGYVQAGTELAGGLFDDQDATTWTAGEIVTDVGSSAATGAQLGSKFGPVGTGVGAVIGTGVGIYKGITGRKEAREAEAKAKREEAMRDQSTFVSNLNTDEVADMGQARKGGRRRYENGGEDDPISKYNPLGITATTGDDKQKFKYHNMMGNVGDVNKDGEINAKDYEFVKEQAEIAYPGIVEASEATRGKYRDRSFLGKTLFPNWYEHLGEKVKETGKVPLSTESDLYNLTSYDPNMAGLISSIQGITPFHPYKFKDEEGSTLTSSTIGDEKYPGGTGTAGYQKGKEGYDENWGVQLRDIQNMADEQFEPTEEYLKQQNINKILGAKEEWNEEKKEWGPVTGRGGVDIKRRDKYDWPTDTSSGQDPNKAVFKQGKQDGGMRKYLEGGRAVSLPGGAVEFQGRTHEEGGILLDKYTEVEDKETMDKVEGQDYFFSSHLKLGGKSFSQRHKDILNSGGNQNEIDLLAQIQEKKAGRSEYNLGGERKMYFGGGKKLYANGGKKPYDFDGDPNYTWEENADGEWEWVYRDPTTQDLVEEGAPGSGDATYYKLQGEWYYSDPNLLPEVKKFNSRSEMEKHQETNTRDYDYFADNHTQSQEDMVQNLMGKAKSQQRNIVPAEEEIVAASSDEGTVVGNTTGLYNDITMSQVEPYMEEIKTLTGINDFDFNNREHVLNLQNTLLGGGSGQDYGDLLSGTEGKYINEAGELSVNKSGMDGLFGIDTFTALQQHADAQVADDIPESNVQKDKSDPTGDGCDCGDGTFSIDCCEGNYATTDPVTKEEEPTDKKKKLNLGKGENWIGALIAGSQLIPSFMAMRDKPDYMKSPERIPATHLDRVSFNDQKASNSANYRGLSRFIEQSGAGPGAIAAKMGAWGKKQQMESEINAQEARANAGIQNQEAQLNQAALQNNIKNSMYVNEFNSAADAATKDTKRQAVQSGVQSIAGMAKDYMAYKGQNDLARATAGNTNVLDNFYTHELDFQNQTKLTPGTPEYQTGLINYIKQTQQPATAKMGGLRYHAGGLYHNINHKKKSGKSKSKSKSTISDEAYANMEAGFPKKMGGTRTYFRRGGSRKSLKMCK